MGRQFDIIFTATKATPPAQALLAANLRGLLALAACVAVAVMIGVVLTVVEEILRR